MEREASFPTFECIISNTNEDYDSEVENFFLLKNYVVIGLSRLRREDIAWKDNYSSMMKYLDDLGEAIALKKDVPSHQFLIELSMGEEIEDPLMDRLSRSDSPLVADLAELGMKVREMMYWYVRNGKNTLFSEAFNPARFQGLPFLRLALTYRSVAISQSK